MQQMAYVCNLKLNGNSGVNVSEDQLLQVVSFISPEGILAYENDSADHVKSAFNTEHFKNNLKENLKTYIWLGLKNPGCYLRVFRDMTAPYFDSDRFRYPGLMFYYPFQGQYESFADIYIDSKLPSLYEILVYLRACFGYKDIPILSLLLKASICT